MSASATLERTRIVKLDFMDTWANYYALALLITCKFADDKAFRAAIRRCHYLLHSSEQSISADPSYTSIFIQDSPFMDGHVSGGC